MALDVALELIEGAEVVNRPKRKAKEETGGK
jgi:hypothetical protein